MFGAQMIADLILLSYSQYFVAYLVITQWEPARPLQCSFTVRNLNLKHKTRVLETNKTIIIVSREVVFMIVAHG